MIIKALVENTSRSKDLGCEHGLSLYIETRNRKILFDVGASELFLENARKLKANISDVDSLIVSHGHRDHGGGLRAFLRENKKARVFLHPLAFEKHYASRPKGALESIGLEEESKESRLIVFTTDWFPIDDGAEVFSNVPQRQPRPRSNGGLFVERGGQLVADEFSHEQNLILEEDGSTLLITGCAHNGIVNILAHFHALKGRMPDCVIGGFHLSSRSGENESLKTIERIGKELLATKAKYYTCHCTGLRAYRRLKTILGERIDDLSTGDEINIPAANSSDG